jgi:type II secretory ATPase GspE/PulE/Tfp pilus assembly ATPase PilB-like protein
MSDTSPNDPGAADLAAELEALLVEAKACGASDIHLEPAADLGPRLRIDGALVESEQLAHASEQLVRHIKEVASLPGPWSAYEVPKQYLLDAYAGLLPPFHPERRGLESNVLHLGRVQHGAGWWRTATMPGAVAERLCLHRVLDGPPPLEAVGLSSSERAALRTIGGMVIFSGPPGHGTTTTLYAALSDSDPRRRAIVTFEEVIEAMLPGVHQIELAGRRVNLGALLRGAVQQDADIVGVGAMVAYATASLAVTATLGGTKVFATMQLNDSVSAVSRLFQMGVEPYLVIAVVGAVVNQRLLRLNCADCATPDTPPREHVAALEAMGLRADRLQVGRGCPRCANTGVSGRAAVAEVFTVTPELSDLVLQGASSAELQEEAVAGGMQTLRERALALAAEGKISLAEALRATPRPMMAKWPSRLAARS